MPFWTYPATFPLVVWTTAVEDDARIAPSDAEEPEAERPQQDATAPAMPIIPKIFKIGFISSVFSGL